MHHRPNATGLPPRAAGPLVNLFVILTGVLALALLVPPGVLATFGDLQSAGARVRRNLLHLRAVLPGVDRFTSEDGVYEHFRGYTRGSDGRDTFTDLAFLTTDVGARVTGYKGPINVMVGMDLRGTLIGITVVDHVEPYGARSIEQPAYRNQFPGKHVRQMFHVGTDIDSVSGATMTVRAATDAIRRGSRRMIREFLREQAASQYE